MNPSNCAIIILAAGKSSRLGTPKQLVLFQGKTLLEHAIDTAVETNIKPVIIVLGADFQKIRSSIAHTNVPVIENPDWKNGMSTSIHSGLNELIHQYPLINRIIIMVCDQPFVSSDLLLRLVKVQSETGLPIVASTYQDIIGTPALFESRLFDALLALNGDAGAGKLIRQNPEKTALIPFPEGMIDIDTVEDYIMLNA